MITEAGVYRMGKQDPYTSVWIHTKNTRSANFVSSAAGTKCHRSRDWPTDMTLVFLYFFILILSHSFTLSFIHFIYSLFLISIALYLISFFLLSVAWNPAGGASRGGNQVVRHDANWPPVDLTCPRPRLLPHRCRRRWRWCLQVLSSGGGGAAAGAQQRWWGRCWVEVVRWWWCWLW